jgi:hypothetical protein
MGAAAHIHDTWGTRSMRRLGLVGGASALMTLIVLVLVSAASAATITVSSTKDSGAGSLRQAIEGAGSGDTIVLPASKTPYEVTSDALFIEKNLTIDGAGAANTVINAMGSETIIFEVRSAIATMSGLTITGSKQAGIQLGEGVTSASLTLSAVAVSGNGKAGIDGAAVETYAHSALTVDASTIENNEGYNGAALYLGGQGTIANSTIANNRSLAGGDGGGLQSNELLTMTGDTVAHNTSLNSGGGLFLGGHTTITNSTISENQAADGGGLENRNSLTLLNDTIAGNESTGGHGSGGGIDGSATATNTIIADNSDNEGHIDNCSEALTAGGPNLENGKECGFAAHGGISEANPLLGPLARNGGPTETQRLLPGSPAIEGGANTECPATDQRGIVRPVGLKCDIGAVEYAPPVASTGTATSITQSSATLNGVVNSLGIGGVTWYFQWGPSTNYGNQTPSTATAALGSEGVAATLPGLPAGSAIHYRLVVSDSEGTSDGSDQTLTTSSSPGTSTGPPARPPLPVLTAVSQSATRWIEKKIRKSKTPVGTTFRYTLNVPATVTFKFTQSAPGRKVGKSCVAQTKKNKGKRSCTRTILAGTLAVAGKVGTNKVPFAGRLSAAKKLAPGRYTVIVTATNTAGSSVAQKLSFTISTR